MVPSAKKGSFHWTRGVVVLSVAFASGCGDAMHRLGGPGSEGTPEPVIALCREQADYELIDDMEDAFDSILNVEERSGFWFAFNDGTGGAQEPKPNVPLYPMASLDPPRLDSSLGKSWYGIGTTGSGFTNWGAGIGFDLRSHLPYDASPYTGIAFWARAPGETTTSVRMGITDANTAPQGGVCFNTDNIDVMGRCYDNFGADVVLSNEWQFYRYSWSDLKQEGFSKVVQKAIVNSKLYGVRFQVGPVPFDFLIDDVVFICPRN